MSKRKLLLADDSVTIQKVVNLTFAEEGIEVITAGDGNSAMEKFVQTQPDLIMIDVNMPGIDGYKICEMIKQDEKTNRIPVILLVGSFEPFDEEEARRVGADDYLTKPFQSIRQLVSRVSDLLNRSSNGDAATYNKNNFSSPNQPATETPLVNFNNSPRAIDDENLKSFNDNEMDDEMIQTNQIGSLPVDESQKFISEPEDETPENDFTAHTTNEIEIPSNAEPLATENSRTPPTAPAIGNESFRFDEKIFDFADAPSAVGKIEPEASTPKPPEATDNNKFPQYSTIADESKSASDDGDFKTTQQPTNDSIFDFDEFDLLELPQIENEPTAVNAAAEAAPPVIAENSEAQSAIENKDTTAHGEKATAAELANLSPEVIEAITKKILEKLSAKVIQEIVQEVTPQTVESVIEEMARKKTI